MSGALLTTLSILLELVVIGLTQGAIYGLESLGLSLIFGVMRITNSAHGAFYTIGAYAGFVITIQLGFAPALAIIVAVLATFVIGVLLEVATVDPLTENPSSVMIITFAFAVLTEQISLTLWGGAYLGAKPLFQGETTILGASLENQRWAALSLAVLITLMVFTFLSKTKLGKATRAVSQNKEIAETLGVDVRKISILTFSLGVCLAGVSGALLAPLFSVYPSMGWDSLTLAFVVVILGGMGNLTGTILAGILYGVVESFTEFYIPPLTGILILVVAILVFIFKPSGLLGEVVERG